MTATPSDPLRVAVDATSLLGATTGVGEVTRHVLAGLAADPRVETSAFAVTWRGHGALAGALPTGVRAVGGRSAARPLMAVWRHVGRPTIERWTGPQDVVHGPNFVVPPTAQAAAVVTVHDLTPVHHPELCTRHARTYPAHLRAALRRGAFVHTPSAHVRTEVIDAFAADPERVVHVPNGVDPAPADRPSADPAPIVGSRPYVLALGTVEPRKGLPDLVAAWDAVADETGLGLVVAGPDGWGVEAFDRAVGGARHRDRIVRLGWLDADARDAVLSGAAMLAYPSVYEGFGLPPLEAMARGVPVVSTEAGGLREVVGDGAEVVPVGDRQALAAAIRLVHGDEGRRADLVRAGHERVAAHPWSRTVEGMVDLYRRAADAH